MSRNRGPRLVLAAGILAGLVHAILFPVLHPEQVAIATDTYYHAAQAMLAGDPFYTVSPPNHPGFSFNYPPIVILVFVPHALLDSPLLAYLFQTVLNLLTVTVLAVTTVRFLGRRPVPFTRVDASLVAAYTVLSIPMVSNLVMGQVNVQLALAVAATVVALDAGDQRVAGTALGLAAAVKLFPTLFGAWVLRRRAFQAIAAATATGIGAVGLGLLVFGWGPTETFFTTVVGTEMQVGRFADGAVYRSSFLTIRRQLAVFVPGLGPQAMLLIGGVVLAPVVAGMNWNHRSCQTRIVGLLGTVLATLILFPLEPFYLATAVFPLTVSVYVIAPGWPRRLLLTGVVFLSVPLTYASLRPVIHASVLPPPISEGLASVLRVVFDVALLPMVGVWLVFLAGLALQYQATVRDAA